MSADGQHNSGRESGGGGDCCARTDAVLALHLDGDLAADASQRDPLGYAFVSEQSLHAHLRSCAICQSALQRARRLDALLAAQAGAVALEHLRGSGSGDSGRGDSGSGDSGRESVHGSSVSEGTFSDLADRLLRNAAREARLGCDVEQDAPDVMRAGEPTARRSSVATIPVASRTEHRTSARGADRRRLGQRQLAASWLAAAALTLIAAGGWWWLAIPSKRPAHAVDSAMSAAAAAAAAAARTDETAREDTATQARGPVLPAGGDIPAGGNTAAVGDSGSPQAGSPAAGSPAAIQNTSTDRAASLESPLDRQTYGVPASLAGSLRRAKRRARANGPRSNRANAGGDDGQRTLDAKQHSGTPEEYATRLRDRSLPVAARLASARRLLRATQTGSTAPAHCADLALTVLAMFGDHNRAEIALHDQLLEDFRRTPGAMYRAEQLLLLFTSKSFAASRVYQPSAAGSWAGGTGDPVAQSAAAQAAVVVAARLGTERLDSLLRRALRGTPAIAETIAAALRCGIRIEGSADLLLRCWRDEAAVGRASNSMPEARRWFQGQTATTYAEVATLLKSTRSAPDRERCLYAMGCVGDDSTRAPLLAATRSPRRAEAIAAACALAALPHHVLRGLVARARRDHRAGLLRAALVRADLPETRIWLRRLHLTSDQLAALRTGSPTQFAQLAKVFRQRMLVAD
ncbi:MAG: hypothetical protein AB8H80_21235 [Planctomycetota bacterium]